MTRRRAEKLVAALESGEKDSNSTNCVLYSSGVAAVSAILYLFNPKAVAITKGYMGSINAMRTYAQISKMKIIDMDEEMANSTLGAGDVYFIETPSNPQCILYDIKKFSEIAKAKGIRVVVDSTFASPILQNPLNLGADVVMHSCTKYLGGHSDLLGGALITKDLALYLKLCAQRLDLGSIMGNLEAWLLLRSIRTLKMRVIKQSKNATKVAKFLSKHPRVVKVWHPSLESHPSYQLCKTQMKMDPSCFSFELKTASMAINFPSKLKLIVNATSLGGVESLIDYRFKHDPTVSDCLLRISIGIESAKDLIADLEQALSKKA